MTTDYSHMEAQLISTKADLDALPPIEQAQILYTMSSFRLVDALLRFQEARVNLVLQADRLALDGNPVEIHVGDKFLPRYVGQLLYLLDLPQLPNSGQQG